MDGARLLLDCGWDEAFSAELVAPLAAAIAPEAGGVDAVLLSHSDTAHLGALPYAWRLGLRCPVYATLPVHKMGQMFMYDHYLSRRAFAEFDLFDLDDVDAAFAAVKPLRYSQQAVLQGRAAGITVVPHAAGHTLGGTVWRIAKDAEEIVYAVDYNHRRERHLNGTTLDELRRPTLLITSARVAAQPERRQGGGARGGNDRDGGGAIVQAVLRCVRRDGNALLLSDTAGRSLELIMLLEQAWAAQKLGSYNVVLLTSVAYNTLEFAKSQLEWMSDEISNKFGGSRHNPFQTQHLRLCHSLEELRRLPPVPTVVIASPVALTEGFARHLLAEWAADPRNLVLFTQSPAPGTLGADLLQASRRTHLSAARAKRLSVRLSNRVALSGEELVEWERRRAEAKAAAAAAEEDLVSADAAMAVEVAVEAPEEALVRTGGGNLERLAVIARKEQAEEADAAAGIGAAAVRPPPRPVAGSAFGGVLSHDDYREGGVLFEGCAPGDGPVPMFAHEPLLASADDYGEPCDWEDPSTVAAGASGADGSAAPMDVGADGAKDGAEGVQQAAGDDEAEAMLADEAGGGAMRPTKVVEEMTGVDLRCEVALQAFEGLSDLRSLRTILSHVAPLQAVVVRGSPHETAALAEHLVMALTEEAGGESQAAKVHAPHVMQSVDATSRTAMYRLRLADALMRETRFTRIGGADVARVDGRVRVGASEQDGAEQQDATDAAAAPTMLTLEPMEHADHPAVFLGELRLGDLKQRLERAGRHAQFDAGSLRAGPLVRITKTAPQQVVFEGALSDDYYALREEAYASFVQL